MFDWCCRFADRSRRLRGWNAGFVFDSPLKNLCTTGQLLWLLPGSTGIFGWFCRCDLWCCRRGRSICKDCCELLDRGHLFCAESGEGGCWSGVEECCCELSCRVCGCVCGRCSWHGSFVGKELHRAGDALGSSFGDIASVAAVVVWGMADVPSVDPTRGP